jgi:hypothetical protein
MEPIMFGVHSEVAEHVALDFDLTRFQRAGNEGHEQVEMRAISRKLGNRDATKLDGFWEASPVVTLPTRSALTTTPGSAPSVLLGSRWRRPPRGPSPKSTSAPLTMPWGAPRLPSGLLSLLGCA